MNSVAEAPTRQLPQQLLEVLRDHTMTFEQLSTYYAIKFRGGLQDRLRGAKVGTVREYLEQFSTLFEIVDGKAVRARPKEPLPNADVVPVSLVGTPAPLVTIRYAHVSKAVQKLLNASPGSRMEMAALEKAFQASFNVSIISVVGMSTEEYLQRKHNVFGIEGTAVYLQPEYCKPVESHGEQSKDDSRNKFQKEPQKVTQSPDRAPKGAHESHNGEKADSCAVRTESQTAPGPNLHQPKAKIVNAVKQAEILFVPDVKPEAQMQEERKRGNSNSSINAPSATTLHPDGDATSMPSQNPQSPQPQKSTDKKEGLPLFVVDELVRIFEDQSEGPIMHSSVLCSLFMQRHGSSVTEVSGCKPMELFRQHPQAFIWLSSGNVALEKFRCDSAVQQELRLLDEQPKSVRVKAAAAEASLPVPEHVSEQDVVDYMVGLLLENSARQSIYVSALCGRFMQRFRKPVTEIVGCKPTDFLRRHRDIFYMEKGGHVRLVDPDKCAAQQALPAEAVQNNPDSSETQGSCDALKAAKAESMPVASGVMPPWRRSKERSSGPAQLQEVSHKPFPKSSPLADDVGTPHFGAARSDDSDSKLICGVEDFCAKLKEGLFFKVEKVTMDDDVLADPAEIPVCVAAQLPAELHGAWLPQMLRAIHQLIELKLAERASQALLEEDGVCCLLHVSPEVKVKLRIRVELSEA